MSPRMAVLLVLLGGSLILLHQRSALQVWAYGVGDGTRRLIGKTAPELPPGLKTLGGEDARLQALRGRVVLLHFWTRACGNCLTMLPRYGRFADSYGPKGLVVLGVHTPETEEEAAPAALAAFVRGRAIRWTVVPDNDLRAWQRFGLEAWPTAILIDRAGVVREVYVGDHHDGDIARDIQRLLAS